MIEESLIRKASEGDADSQYMLGVAITDIAMHAQSREQSLSSMKQATHWLLQAAQQGHAAAQFMLGVLCVKGEDFEKAVKFFAQAAENGHAEAQYKLGSCYYSGTGIGQNMLKAVYWYKKAANNGCMTADICYTIALQYTHGLELPKNEKEAVYWLGIGANMGDAISQNELAKCYANGTGIERNMEKAIFWWRKAALQGNKEAQLNIKICDEKSMGINRTEHDRSVSSFVQSYEDAIPSSAQHRKQADASVVSNPFLRNDELQINKIIDRAMGFNGDAAQIPDRKRQIERAHNVNTKPAQSSRKRESNWGFIVAIGVIVLVAILQTLE